MLSSSMSRITVKQHFIPKCYLRFFTSDYRLEDPDLYIYDIKSQSFIGDKKHSISSKFYENWFYDPDRNNETEKFLSNNVELNYKECVEQISNDVHALQDKDINYVILQFTVYQLYRTPKYKETLQRVYNDKFTKELVKKDLDDKITRINNDLGVHFSIPQMIKLRNDSMDSVLNKKIDVAFIESMVRQVDKEYLILRNLNWYLIRNKTNIDFITSDNPVSVYRIDQSDELFFPISNKLALIMVDKGNQIFERNIIEEKYIHELNQKTLDNAHKYLASKEKMPIEYLKKVD